MSFYYEYCKVRHRIVEIGERSINNFPMTFLVDMTFVETAKVRDCQERQFKIMKKLHTHELDTGSILHCWDTCKMPDVPIQVK